MGIFLWTIEQPTAASSVFFTRDHWATNMISLLLLAGAVAAQPYYYMPYAGLEGPAEPNVDEAEARYLINFGVFQLRSATVASVGTSSVSATVRFFQNPLIANDESRYEVEIVNMVAGTEYFVCLLPTNTQRATPVLTDFLSNEVMTARDETTPVALHSGTAPSYQLFGRFTVRGLTKAFNVDGASGKRSINTMGVGIFSRACGGLSLRTRATVSDCTALEVQANALQDEIDAAEETLKEAEEVEDKINSLDENKVVDASTGRRKRQAVYQSPENCDEVKTALDDLAAAMDPNSADYDIANGKQIIDILIMLTAADLSPACTSSDVTDLTSKKAAAKDSAESAVMAQEDLISTKTDELEALNEQITAGGGTPATTTTTTTPTTTTTTATTTTTTTATTITPASRKKRQATELCVPELSATDVFARSTTNFA